MHNARSAFIFPESLTQVLLICTIAFAIKGLLPADNPENFPAEYRFVINRSNTLLLLQPP
jgi:hypothetical protein